MIQIPPPPIPQATWDSWPIGERMAQLNAYLCDVLKVHEQPMGSNSGPEIDMFLAFCGLPPGEPWCNAQQIWCAHACGVPDADLPPLGIRGSTVQCLAWAKRMGRESVIPLRGDFATHVDADGVHGHEGCYLGPMLHDDGKTPVVGMVRTIEGNTNTDGSSEGWEDVRHNRPLSYWRGFYRLW